MGLDGASLLTGLIIGFTSAFIIGTIAGKMFDALQGTHAPDKSMVVPTKDTLRDVMRRAASAMRRFLIVLVALLFVGGALIWIVVKLFQTARW